VSKVIFSGRSGHGLVLSAANFAANKATSDCSRLHLTALLADSVTAAKSTFWQVNHDSRIMAQVYFNPSIANQHHRSSNAIFDVGNEFRGLPVDSQKTPMTTGNTP
jgi:hypothetical protein